MDSHRFSHVDLLTNWFVASTKFWVNDGIVVVAAEEDAAVSLITDVSIVQQMERPSALMDSISLFVDSDGQVPRETFLIFTNCVSSGDWGSAEYVTSTPRTCCPLAPSCSKGLVNMWRRNAVRAMPRFFCCSDSEG